MSRNRRIYQSNALVTSIITGQSTGINLTKITEATVSAEVSRTDVNIFGKLAAIDRIILDEPTVTLDFGYYLTDGENESKLGFAVAKSGDSSLVNFISGHLANASGANRNFFMVTVPEGTDAHAVAGNSANNVVVGVGNAFISKYNVSLRVGEIPSASLSADASNFTAQNATSNGVQNPAISVTGVVPSQYTGFISLPTINVTGDGQVTVLRPGDIVLDFGTADLDMGGAVLDGMTSAATKQKAHVNGVTIDVPMSRTPLTRLGNHFAFSKELDVPINVTMTVTADIADVTSGSLVDLVCAGSEERDISITLYGPCEADDVGAVPKLTYTLKGATLDSQSIAETIGSNDSVELKFTAQVGGINDQTKGLFVSGSYVP